MIQRSLLYRLHREREGLSRHTRLSSNVLSRLTRLLDRYPLPYRIVYNNPYQLIIYCNEATISVHAGGWDRRMDVIRLRVSGKPYSAKTEKSFMTPPGVVNYILKKWGHPKKVG